MSEGYEEILAGESYLRPPPDARHERVCARLHSALALALNGSLTTRLLPPRTIVELCPGTLIRPDLALVTCANRRLWLAGEVVGANDHGVDTVTKKELYEQTAIPRLWMVDPRYDNVEVYQGSPYGLSLRHILAGREALSEALLPGLRLTIAELFGD
jgi:Uma2 family endonuclease